MEKVKKVSKIKQYYQLVEPHKWILVILYAIQIAHVALKAVTTIFTARIIVGVYQGIETGNFSYAYENLFLEFLFIFLRNVFTWLNYITYTRMFRQNFINIQSKTINKILNASQSNFTSTSREKIQNILVSDVDTLACYPDSICTKSCKVIQAIISLVIVAQANIWVALILLITCGINFFIIKFIYNKVAFYKKKQSEACDVIYEEANRIMRNKEIINEFHVGRNYDKSFKEKCLAYTKADKKRYTWVGVKESWFYIYYNLVIAILTAAMIFLVSKGGVSMELYLIVVPYFLSVTELFNSFFEITNTISFKNVSLSRVNTILNFSNEELSKFGDISAKLGGTNISFVGVNYSCPKSNSPYSGVLQDVDISFSSKSINMVYGEKRCGKRLIFNMLRRKISPDSGVIMLDNINLNEYKAKTFHSNIFYCVAHPEFIDGTIMENMMAITRKKRDIYEVFKYLGIYDLIMSKPNKFNNKIDKTFTRAEKFLLGLARALLTDCDTLLIYEMPAQITKRDKAKILTLIQKISRKKTVVFFTYTDAFREMAKTVYQIENGKVVDIDINDTPDFKLLEQEELKILQEQTKKKNKKQQ